MRALLLLALLLAACAAARRQARVLLGLEVHEREEIPLHLACGKHRAAERRHER